MKDLKPRWTKDYSTLKWAEVCKLSPIPYQVIKAKELFQVIFEES
jgi:ribosomal protein L15E